MPPSVHKLTPFEKRLRRVQFWRSIGHEPKASNCYWADTEDRLWPNTKFVCRPCAELRGKFPNLT